MVFALSERLSRIVQWVVLPVLVGCVAAYAADEVVLRFHPLSLGETIAAPDDGAAARVPVDESLQIVNVENGTVARLGQNSLGGLKRGYYARFVRGLERAGARTLLLDLIMDKPLDEDRELADALRSLKSLRVTLATGYVGDDDDSNAPSWRPTERGMIGTFYRVPLFDPRTMPRVRLGSATNGVGSAESDLLVGFVPVQDSVGGSPAILHAAVLAFLQYNGLVDRDYVYDPGNGFFSCGSLQLSLQGNHQVNVRFPVSKSAIPAMEFSQALRMLDDPVRAQRFKDKIVVVGRVGSGDVTSVKPFGKIDGDLFMAMALNTILQPAREQLEDAPLKAYLLEAGLLAALGFASALGRRPVLSILGVAALCAAAWCLPDWLVAHTHVVFPRLIPLLAVLFAAVAGLLASVSRLFRTDHRPSGATEEATVLFVDIRGSTRLLDELGVERFRPIVVGVLDALTKVVRENGGVVEGTRGDGLLAVFRPKAKSHHAIRAVAAAVSMVEETKRWSSRCGTEIRLGIGVETGLLSGSYVTEGANRVWSSAGLAVNLSQRLQAASDGLGSNIVLGPVAGPLVHGLHRVRVRPLGMIDAKGFDSPVQTYTLDHEGTS